MNKNSKISRPYLNFNTKNNEIKVVENAKISY